MIVRTIVVEHNKTNVKIENNMYNNITTSYVQEAIAKKRHPNYLST